MAGHYGSVRSQQPLHKEKAVQSGRTSIAIRDQYTI